MNQREGDLDSGEMDGARGIMRISSLRKDVAHI